MTKKELDIQDIFDGLFGRTYVYRLFGDNDELLYVGCTAYLAERLATHRQQKPWWREVRRYTATSYWPRAEALKAEWEAIQTERPKYNVVGNPERLTATQDYAIVTSDEWRELGYESYTEWYVGHVWPLMLDLGVRPIPRAAAGVLQRIRTDEASLPPAQRRTQRELAELVGVSDKTLRMIGTTSG